MASSKNRVLWDFFANTKPLEKGLGRAQRGFKDTQKGSDVLKGGIGQLNKVFGAFGLALGAREVVQWTGDALQLAIAADEVDSKFQAVFGRAREFTGALSEWADMAGITDTKSRDLAATFGNLAMSVGLPNEATEDLTLSVATLAGDMASFNDSDPAEVFNTLNTAVLTAERDGLKKYGIAVAESEVQTRALELAVADGRDEFTKADKALAAYQLISERAGKANGDLERTQDSLANKQRQLTASVEEMKEAFGKELVVALTDATEGVDATEVSLQGLGTTAGKTVTKFLEPMLESLDDVVVATDDNQSATSRWKAALETANGVVSFFSPALRGLNALIDIGGHSADVAADEMEEFKRGMEETAQAIADSKPVTEEYIGFMKQIREERAKHDASVDTSITKLKELEQAFRDFNAETAKTNDPFAIWDVESWGEIWGELDTGRAKAATFNEVLAALRGDPVKQSQQVNDLIDLGGQIGG